MIGSEFSTKPGEGMDALLFLISFVVFGALAKGEQKRMFGSTPLMAIFVAGGLGAGFLVMGLWLPDTIFVEWPIWPFYIAMFCWMAMGYAVYRGINHYREKAYYRRLQMDLD